MAKKVSAPRSSSHKPLSGNTKTVTKPTGYKPLKGNTTTTTTTRPVGQVVKGSGYKAPVRSNTSTKIGQNVKGQGYKAPVRATTPAPKSVKANLPAVKGNNTPAVKSNTSLAKTPAKGNTGIVKSSGKTTIISNNTPSKPKKISYSGVEDASKTRVRAGATKGNTPGTGGKYANKPSIKAPSKPNLPAVKGNTTPAVKGTSKINFGNVGSKLGKYGKYVKGAGKILGKVVAPIAAAATVVDIVKDLHANTDKFTKHAMEKNKGISKGDSKKGTGKTDVKKSERTKTLIETPSLKDELKKRGVETKPVKDNPKTNWLDTAKKGNTLKYGIDAPKSKDTKKDDSKKGALPKAIDKAVRAADGNQPGDGSSLKFTGDRSKVAGKDKWGRSPSSDWYGFNPETKKREAPTMVKADTKKTETKPVVKTTPVKTTPVKKPATTTTPKASTTVDKMETKPVAPIATNTESKKEIIQPKATTTTPSASSSTSSSTTPSSSASAPKTQPRATFGNKIRGALNASRERRAERAESRGNEGKADKLRDKIEDTSKKMVMRKGGTVRKSKKK